MNSFQFRKSAHKKFLKLSKETQKRIQKKMAEYKFHPDIFAVLDPLTDMTPATHRIRIGDYRLVLKWEFGRTFKILDIGHRREVYR